MADEWVDPITEAFPDDDEDRERAIVVITSLYALDDVPRARLIALIGSLFCLHCGANDPNCHCWNDE